MLPPYQTILSLELNKCLLSSSSSLIAIAGAIPTALAAVVFAVITLSRCQSAPIVDVDLMAGCSTDHQAITEQGDCKRGGHYIYALFGQQAVVMWAGENKSVRIRVTHSQNSTLTL